MTNSPINLELIEGREEIYLRHIFRDWTVNKNPLSPHEVEQHVRAYSQLGALRGGFSYYRAAAYGDPPQWRADAGRQLSTPVLFLFGQRRIRTAEAMGAEPLENAWWKQFPNVKAKHMGNCCHFLQWEAPEQRCSSVQTRSPCVPKVNLATARASQYNSRHLD